MIGFQRVVGPRLLGLTPDEAAIAAAMPKARTVFTELSALLGQQPFCAGEAFTLADALLAPQLDFLSATPEWTALTAATPRLCKWLERARARPSLEATTWERVAARATAA